METMLANKQLSRGAGPGHDTQDAGPREAAPCQCFVSQSRSIFFLSALILPTAQAVLPGALQAVATEQGLGLTMSEPGV